MHACMHACMHAYIHACIYIYIDTYIYVYRNLLVNAIFRLPHPQSEVGQGQETFLAPSADKQTRIYDTESALTTIPPYQL